MDKRLIEAIGSGDLVLDLGCGSGEILKDLSGRFERRIGVDISRRRLNEMAGGEIDGWEFREADLNRPFPLESEIADAVVANQVIEHIIEPAGFVREIHRILRPGGRCIITTPNIRYLKNILHLIFSGYGPRTAGGNRLDGAWDDGHVHYFTHRDLRELFAEVGFHHIDSSALVRTGGSVRKFLCHYAGTYLVREFLSGCILLKAEK